jgi:hypothetical protein
MYSIKTVYWLDGLGSIPDIATFSLLYSGQTGGEAYPASYPMGTRVDLLVTKTAEA